MMKEEIPYFSDFQELFWRTERHGSDTIMGLGRNLKLDVMVVKVGDCFLVHKNCYTVAIK